MEEKILFNEFLENRKLADRTIKEYLYYYNNLNLFKELNQQTVNSFINRFNNTMARAFLKIYFSFLKINGELNEEERRIILDLEIPKVTGHHKRKIPDVLSQNQIEQIELEMKSEGEKLMLLLSFYCGLRKSDVCNIKPIDFNWGEWFNNQDDNGVLVVIGKGDKKANLIVPTFLMRRISDIIYSNEKHYTDYPEKKMFYSPNIWSKKLHNASMKGLGFHVKVHTLRHSFGTFCMEQGLDINSIKELMRHENISTTEIYLHINRKKLGEKMKNIFKQVEQEKELEENLNEIQAESEEL